MASFTQATEKTASRWLALLAIVAGAASGAAMYYGLSAGQSTTARRPALEAAQPQAPIRATVAATGRLEPAGEVVRLSAPTAFEGTRLVRLLVREGERVRSGQVVAVLDRESRYRATLAQAEAQVRLAQAKLAQVRSGAKQGERAAQRAAIARIASELEIARAEKARYAALHSEGAVSESLLDSKRLAVRSLEGELAQARSQLATLAEVKPSDIVAAEAEVATAQAAVQRARADLEVAYVRALSDAQVLRIQAWPGETIGSEGILELGQTAQMQAVAEVYETDIARVRVGQRATVNSASGAFAGSLPGTVVEVGRLVAKKDVLSTDPAADIDARVVEVKIRLDPAAARQVENLTNLQVEIAIATGEGR